MRLNSLILIFAILITNALNAQSKKYSLFHNDRELNLGLKYGIGENSHAFGLTGEYLKSRAFGYTFDLAYDSNLPDAFQYTNFQHYRIAGGVLFNPLYSNTANRIFWHLKGQVHFGIENVKSRVEDEIRSGFMYGGTIGTAVDWYLGDGFILGAGINQFYTHGVLIGNFHWETNLAIRYIL